MLLRMLSLLILSLPVRSTPIYKKSQTSTESVRVESIILDSYNGPLNQNILNTYFEKVGFLHIKNSNITELSTTTLKLLTNLENLTISDSFIGKATDDIFNDCCPKLRNLEVINWYNMDESDLKGIGTLPLHSLWIAHQNLSNIKADILKNINLRTLILDHDEIETLDNAVFDDLYKLESLTLSWNKFHQIPKETLAPLKKLRILHLETDLFEKFSVNNLTYLPHLRDIYLSKIGLKEVSLSNFEEKVPKLKNLYLSGCDGVHDPESKGPTIHT